MYVFKQISSATRKCRRPLFNNCGVCRRASGAAPGARPRPNPTCRGAGAAGSLGGQLQTAELFRGQSEATFTCAIATRAAHAKCTCACAWLRARLNRPHGDDWANPGNYRMQIPTALALMGLGPRLRSDPWAARWLRVILGSGLGVGLGAFSGAGLGAGLGSGWAQVGLKVGSLQAHFRSGWSG